MTTLQDYGERALIESVVSRYCEVLGDDCATLSLGAIDLIVTTDPVPDPAARLIGGDPDPYWAGWLLVVINASDLAAAAATPRGFVAAVDAPAATLVADFERFLAGVADACRAEELEYVGGNLREGPRFVAVGTAFGTCETGKALRRTGASAGDILVSIGRGGRFWDDAFAHRAGLRNLDRSSSPLFRPRSQSRATRALAAVGVVKACIDNSDGLLPSLQQLASANCLGARLDLDLLPTPSEGPVACDDPARLWLGWGDWNVIAAINPQKLEAARSAAAESGTELIRIGEMLPGRHGVSITRGGTTVTAPRLESERFAKDSWFSRGIEGYIDLLMNVDLPI